MGCRRATEPGNCRSMSCDDPVQLNRESLPRLCDGDSGCVKGLLQTLVLFFLERGAEMRPCEDAGIKERKRTDLTTSKPRPKKKPSSEINVIHAHIQPADVYV